MNCVNNCITGCYKIFGGVKYPLPNLFYASLPVLSNFYYPNIVFPNFIACGDSSHANSLCSKLK